MFRNNPNFAASEAMRTMDVEPNRWLSDPKYEAHAHEQTLDMGAQKLREFSSKSPLGFSTIQTPMKRTFISNIPNQA